MFEDTTPPTRAARLWHRRAPRHTRHLAPRRMRRRIPTVRAAALLVSLSALAWATGSAAQEVRDEDLVTVKGTVIDVVTAQPLPGVLVVVEGAGVRAESDDAGQFTLARIPVGAYKLELSRDGYRTSLHQFAVLNSGEFVTSMEPMDHSAEGALDRHRRRGDRRR